MKWQGFLVLAAAVLFLLAFGSKTPALYYAAIVIVSFVAVRFFAVVARPPAISKNEFLELNQKYAKKVFWVDLFSILFVLIGSALLFLFLNFIKQRTYAGALENAVFESSPQGLLFLASFLLLLSIAGWLFKAAVKILFGSEYWKYYYNRPEVGFDTEKIYRIISVAALLLAIPCLLLGFLDHSVVTENGLRISSWEKINTVEQGWGSISKITAFGTENGGSFYAIAFSDSTSWNLSNEKWNAAEEQVIAYISQKSGVNITQG